jgi:hypothetical protein
MEKPWILVWDMDETLTSPSHPSGLNIEALSFLEDALQTGEVKYNFLLTNNPDVRYISKVIQSIKPYITKEKIFDAIKYTTNDTYKFTHKLWNRTPIHGIPATTERSTVKEGSAALLIKDISDIVDMLAMVQGPEAPDPVLNTETLLTQYRIMFFDDRRHWLSDRLDKLDQNQYRYKQIDPYHPQSFQEEMSLITNSLYEGLESLSANAIQTKIGGRRKGRKGKNTRKSQIHQKKRTKKLTKSPRSK